MPHQIIEISELTQLVADHLLLVGSKSLVSLACTCRALEEQALSTLWSEQWSLERLIKSTLPPEMLDRHRFPPVQPTRMEWDRFRRYASWMRQLRFGSDLRARERALRMISLNSLNGIVCPGLRNLTWAAQSYTLPFYHLFISPHLTAFSFQCTHFRGRDPDEVLSNLAPMIAELQTSSLQSFQVDLSINTALTLTDLDSALSSAVLRCGSSLTTLTMSVPLSDAAVQHIMQLPKLTAWTTTNGLPRVSDSSPPDAFPTLKSLELHTKVSIGWIPFFVANARRSSSGRSAHIPPNRGPDQQLTTLICRAGAPVDAAFTSNIMLFHGLVHLELDSSCSSGGGCAFGLADDNVAEIAIALPNLTDATFGDVCATNSCRTTVCSLLFLSTRCKNLEFLEIHFNTTNLRDDLESMPENPRLRDLRAFPRCQLRRFSATNAPLWMHPEDYVPVATGFLDIFPSLYEVYGTAAGWDGLNSNFQFPR